MDDYISIIFSKNLNYILYAEETKLCCCILNEKSNQEYITLNNFTDKIIYFKVFSRTSDHLIVLILSNFLLYLFKFNDQQISTKLIDLIFHSDKLNTKNLRIVQNSSLKVLNIESSDTLNFHFFANLYTNFITKISLIKTKDKYELQFDNYKYFGNELTNIHYIDSVDKEALNLLTEQSQINDKISSTNYVKMYLDKNEKEAIFYENEIFTLTFNCKYKSEVISNYIIYLEKDFVIKFISQENFKLQQSIDISSLLEKNLNLDNESKFINTYCLSNYNEYLLILVVTSSQLIKLVLKKESLKIEISEIFKIKENYISELKSIMKVNSLNQIEFAIISKNEKLFIYNLNNKILTEKTFKLSEIFFFKFYNKFNLVECSCFNLKGKDNQINHFYLELFYQNSINQSELISNSNLCLNKVFRTIIQLKSISKDLDGDDCYFRCEVFDFFIESKIFIMKIVYYYQIFSVILNSQGEILFSFNNEIIKSEMNNEYYCLFRDSFQVLDKKFVKIFSLNLEYSFDFLIENKKIIIIQYNNIKFLTVNKEKILVSSEYNFENIIKSKEKYNYLSDIDSNLFIIYSLEDNSHQIFTFVNLKFKSLTSNFNSVLNLNDKGKFFTSYNNKKLFIALNHKLEIYSSEMADDNIVFMPNYIITINQNILKNLLSFNVIFNKNFTIVMEIKDCRILLHIDNQFQNFFIEFNDKDVLLKNLILYKIKLSSDELSVEFNQFTYNNITSKTNKLKKEYLFDFNITQIKNLNRSKLSLVCKDTKEIAKTNYSIINLFNNEIYADLNFNFQSTLFDLKIDLEKKFIFLLVNNFKDKVNKLIFMKLTKNHSETNKLRESSLEINLSNKRLFIKNLKIVEIENTFINFEFIPYLNSIFLISGLGKIIVYELKDLEFISIYESFYSFSKSELKEINLNYSNEKDLEKLFQLDKEMNFIEKYSYLDYILIESKDSMEILGIKESYLILIFGHGCLIFTVLEDKKIKSSLKIKFYQQFSFEFVEKTLKNIVFLNFDQNIYDEYVLIFEKNKFSIKIENKKFLISNLI